MLWSSSYPAMNTDHEMLLEELPASQESQTYSQASQISFTSIATPLIPSSSNVSTTTTTTTDTQLTSPTSSNDQSTQFQRGKVSESPIRATQADSRPQNLNTDVRTPATRPGFMLSAGSSEDASITSPMGVDAPILAQGAKRTANGELKPLEGGGNATGPLRTVGHSRFRNLSLDSNTSNVGRIGELSAQLKTRLSYAMVKIQHGWDTHTLQELEEQHSRKIFPSANTRMRHSDSPQSYSRRRRNSATSDDGDIYLESPHSKSLNGTPNGRLNLSPVIKSLPASHTLQSLSGMELHPTVTAQGVNTPPALAPAATIISRKPRRSTISQAPPSLLSAQKGGQSRSDLGPNSEGPRTPRAGILRMPSQQAEKDAVDTLLFMSSPNNSGYLPQTAKAAAQPRPLRADLTMVPKRVVFEADMPNTSQHRTLPVCQPPSSSSYQPMNSK